MIQLYSPQYSQIIVPFWAINVNTVFPVMALERMFLAFWLDLVHPCKQNVSFVSGCH